MSTKGRCGKVYSINREKLKEAIKGLDEVSKIYKDMLKKTEKGKIPKIKNVISQIMNAE